MGKGYLARAYVIAQAAHDAVVQVQRVCLFAIFPEPVEQLWLQVSRACLVALAAVDAGN